MGRAAADAGSCDGGRDWADSDSTAPGDAHGHEPRPQFPARHRRYPFVLSDTPGTLNGNLHNTPDVIPVRCGGIRP